MRGFFFERHLINRHFISCYSIDRHLIVWYSISGNFLAGTYQALFTEKVPSINCRPKTYLPKSVCQKSACNIYWVIDILIITARLLFTVEIWLVWTKCHNSSALMHFDKMTECTCFGRDNFLDLGPQAILQFLHFWLWCHPWQLLKWHFFLFLQTSSLTFGGTKYFPLFVGPAIK